MSTAVGTQEIEISIGVKNPLLTALVIRRLILEAARALRYTRPFAVSVQIVGPAKSKALNKMWRGKDTPTNVLSFAAREGTMPRVTMPVEDLGDIILCPAVIIKEAPLFEMSVSNHARRLVVHGFLHLLGHDHGKDADAKSMEALEARILKNA